MVLRKKNALEKVLEKICVEKNYGKIDRRQNKKIQYIEGITTNYQGCL